MEPTLQKLGEIPLSKIDGAELLKLDPSVPYLIIVSERTPTDVVKELVAFLGRSNVLATVIQGDSKAFKIFGSFPWNVRPISLQETPHSLDLPDDELAALLKSYFISPNHEDAESVQELYGLIKSQIQSTSLVVNDAVVGMIQNKILRSGVLMALYKHEFPKVPDTLDEFYQSEVINANLTFSSPFLSNVSTVDPGPPTKMKKPAAKKPAAKKPAAKKPAAKKPSKKASKEYKDNY